MTTSRAFFPLRSNIGWYSAPELRQRIERTFKEALLIYDEVFLEAGTYTATVLEHGSVGFYSPPGSTSHEMCKIDVERDFKPGDMTFSFENPTGSGQFTPILHGHAYARFKINFDQLVEPLRDNGSCCIKLIVFDPTTASDSSRNLISRMNFDDQRHLAPGPQMFFDKMLVQNVNRDVVAALMLNSALVLDDRHDVVLRNKCMNQGSIHMQWTGEHPVVHNLVTVAVPDFDRLSVIDILDLRSDKRWQEFRCAIGEIASRADGLTDTDIQKALSRALVRELEAKHKSGVKLVIELILGGASCLPTWGPVGTAISTAKGVYEFIRDRGTWIAFVLRIRRDAAAKDTHT